MNGSQICRSMGQKCHLPVLAWGQGARANTWGHWSLLAPKGQLEAKPAWAGASTNMGQQALYVRSGIVQVLAVPVAVASPGVGEPLEPAAEARNAAQKGLLRSWRESCFPSHLCCHQHLLHCRCMVAAGFPVGCDATEAAQGCHAPHLAVQMRLDNGEAGKRNSKVRG